MTRWFGRHWWFLLVFFYVLLRIFIFSALGFPARFFNGVDSAGYLYYASHDPLGLHAATNRCIDFICNRPLVYPSILALLKSNFLLIFIVQLGVSILAWLFLAWVVAKKMSSFSLKVLGFVV